MLEAVLFPRLPWAEAQLSFPHLTFSSVHGEYFEGTARQERWRECGQLKARARLGQSDHPGAKSRSVAPAPWWSGYCQYFRWPLLKTEED